MKYKFLTLKKAPPMSNISEDRDLNRLEIEIRNKLAQEHNWDKKEQHYLEIQKHHAEIQEQFAKQRNHWLNQKGYWWFITTMGVIALFLNFFGGKF